MLRSIQISRGVAAMMVVFYHLSITFGDERFLGHKVFSEYTWRGNFGVDFFFVLSGFIILFAHEKDMDNPGRLQDYAFKRFVRLYPIYWFFTIIVLAANLLHLSKLQHAPVDVWQWLSTLTLVRFADFEPLVRPAWTLFHEIAFYAVFAIFIVSRKAGALAFGVWMAACLLAFRIDTAFTASPAFVYISSLNLEFLFGMGAYLLFKRGGERLAWSAGAAGLVVLAGNLIAESHGLVFPLQTLVYGVGFAGLIAAMARLETHRFAVNLPVAEFLGNASYTIYLSNEFVMTTVMKTMMPLRKGLHLPDWAFYLLAAVLTVGIGSMIYLAVERPMLTFMRSRYQSAKRVMLEAA